MSYVYQVNLVNLISFSEKEGTIRIPLMSA